MLPETMHGHVDKLQAGQLSEPIVVLEGVALVRLDERKQALQRRFEDVAERGAGLFSRERGDKVWAEFLAGLRGKANVRIDTQRYPFLKTEDAQGR
jgi:parvulin-like peptidyl-prolyl isomerase